ncbi:hypothetical protein Sjap_026338 [Stephania japonica]|uniref:Uncharacterized protein n=1 Tax=Stephania japonica TaxID=461633 RepID=A0AAP0E6U1_9MAGN
MTWGGMTWGYGERVQGSIFNNVGWDGISTEKFVIFVMLVVFDDEVGGAQA